jgi:hypothetical protein
MCELWGDEASTVAPKLWNQEGGLGLEFGLVGGM